MKHTDFSNIRLNLFEDAGTLVNTTVNYANAYDAEEGESFDSHNTLAAELKVYYDTELLKNVKPMLVYSQFAKHEKLPDHHGNVVEWRKWNTFDKAEQLIEGVIPTGQKFGMSYIQDSLGQFGTYVTVSDKLELRAFDDVILGATEELASSAAETQEWLIRQKLLAGMNAMYAQNIASDGTAVDCTSCAQMGASDSGGWAKLTADTVARAVARLKKQKAPTINGYYYCVIHPSVAYDLRSSQGWIAPHQYAKPGEIFNGEIGELHGCRFIENPDAPVLLRSGYLNKDGTATYASFLFGKDAFAMVDPEDGLEMVVHDKDEIGGPLNQFSTIGYKFETNGACVLYPERCLRIMSTSTFSATDDAN